MADRKLIVVDLDDTLWEGNVGDLGPAGVRPVVDLQRELLSLKDRGILLAVASKNDERAGLDGIRHAPGMLLRESDFVAHRIGWFDKAGSIASIASDLRLGLDSFVFIDNSIHERERVREALPSVLVPDWPNAPDEYAAALRGLGCFGTGPVTDEDRLRTEMYARERARAMSRAPGSTLADWLRELRTTVDTRELVDDDLPRTVQLLNKTNQMNLTTRRLNERELVSWLAFWPGRHVFTVRVADRFGDAGLTGIIGLDVDLEAEELLVTDFVLSCRVMGRLVEEAMVDHIVKHAMKERLVRVVATLVPTGRNGPCEEFWTLRSGFRRDGNTFTREVSG